MYPFVKQMAGDYASIQVVIPVRNEAATIESVVENLFSIGLCRIRVVDNGSSDASAERAHTAGAVVVKEPRPGYGRACWRGCRDLDPEIEWILFCDGDGSDAIDSATEWLEIRHRFDLMLGDRTATPTGRAELKLAQRWGNRLATCLIAIGWGHRYRDLGPFRLIRRNAFDAMAIQDRGFGWTIEMQVRALEMGLRITEIPVPYHPRLGGESKISGRLFASIQAGMVIIATIVKLFLRRLGRGFQRRSSPG